MELIERKRETQRCKICNLADAYVDAEIAKGEALCVRGIFRG